MKVLVTGGGGFIGAWIIKRLVDIGHSPVVFDLGENRKTLREIAGDGVSVSLPWIKGDIADSQAVNDAAKDCKAILHLAGLLTPACQANPVLGAQVNVIGTLNVFLAARSLGLSKVLTMSSMGVFGPEGGDRPSPTTLYGAFKYGGEFAARAFYADHGISSIAFRPYVVYGPGREGGLSAGPSIACKAAARREDYTIPFSGEIDLIHVDDVADAFLQALEAPVEGAHAVNLWGEGSDVGGVVEAIRQAEPGSRINFAGPPMPIVMPSRDDAVKALLPNWKPRSLDQGVFDTIAHYR